MKAVRVVAINTVKEIIRDRILYGLIVLAGLLVITGILLGELSFTDQAHIITDLGLAAVELGCCMLAIFVGSSLVWREIEKQTVLLLISKPVKRSAFLIGKFFGMTFIIILVNLLFSLFLGILCKFYGDVHWQQYFISQVGTLLEAIVLLAFSLFFGVFCRPVLTTIFSLSCWLIGHGVNDLHYFSQKSHSPFVQIFGKTVSHVFPNFDYFNFRGAVVYGDAISLFHVVRAFGLAAAWFAILLVTSIWIFNKRDFI